MRKSLIVLIAFILIVALPVMAFDNIIILIAGNHGKLIINKHSLLFFLQVFVFLVAPILLVLLIKKVDSLSPLSINFFRFISLIITAFLMAYAWFNIPKFGVQIYFVLSLLLLTASVLLTVLLFMPLRNLRDN
jgi:hypothetical protein